jgi:hypothetical protein
LAAALGVKVGCCSKPSCSSSPVFSPRRGSHSRTAEEEKEKEKKEAGYVQGYTVGRQLEEKKHENQAGRTRVYRHTTSQQSDRKEGLEGAVVEEEQGQEVVAKEGEEAALAPIASAVWTGAE